MSAPEIHGFQFVRTEDLPWRPSRTAAGIFLKDVAVADGWEMQIVRVEPGARFPTHTHGGPEFLFVLEASSSRLDGISGRAGQASPARGRWTTTSTRRRAVYSFSSIGRDRAVPLVANLRPGGGLSPPRPRPPGGTGR